jgi:hypothetical protein
MPAYRKPGTRLITGIEELDKKLETMKLGAANKIARPVLNVGARHLLKKIKADVPAALLGTGNRQTSSGKSTGSMPAQLPGLIKNATLAARSEMLSLMRAEGAKRLAALAAKGG